MICSIVVIPACEITPIVFQTAGPDDTRRLGAALGRMLQAGDVLCLWGGLGAGKTTFVQGIAWGLGYSGRVTSPTFTVMHEYAGRLRLYHLDCYRLSGPADLDELGYEDWLGVEGVSAIEWPDRVLPALPSDRLNLYLNDAGDEREIKIVTTGPRSRQLAEALPAAYENRTYAGTSI